MARGDVLFVDLPYQQGREQAGARPAIAVQAENSGVTIPTLMVVPCTSKLKANRFPYTVQVSPSPTNGLTQETILLVFQLRAIDKGRIIRTAGQLESHYLEQLSNEIKHLLDL